MKYVFVIMVMIVNVFADLEMKQNVKKPDISLPIEQPIRPIHPVRPIINTGPVYQDNYYNTNVIEQCDRYIVLLEEKDKEIAALKEELYVLRSKAQENLSKTLKHEYEAELKKFDERKSSVKTNHSVTITH